MIHDVDATLRALIERDVLNGPGVELSFDAPTKEWAAKLSLPTINVFLYDIREDPTAPRRVLRGGARRGRQGHRATSAAAADAPRVPVVGVDEAGRGRAPPAVRPARLLPRAPTCSHPICSSARSPTVGRPVITQTAISTEGADQFSEVWGALGGELRPSIHLAVIAPFDVSRSMPVGPPVTETPRITVVRPDDVTEAPDRPRVVADGRRVQPAAEAAPVPALPDEVVRAGAEDEPGRVFRVRAMPERR